MTEEISHYLSVNGNSKKPRYMLTTHKAKFSIKNFCHKCDQIHSFLRIWSHLLKKSLMENFIFCVVVVTCYFTICSGLKKFGACSYLALYVYQTFF